MMFDTDTKLGVLGGGQLGKMLLQAASSLNIKMHILDPNPEAPAASLTNYFTVGDFNNYEDVLEFGKLMDIITIEIENVNVEALQELERMGKKVHPSSRIISMIKDKGVQKEFYKSSNLPSSEFELFENAQEIRNAVDSGKLQLPFIQKSRTEGYDGKGVLIVNSKEQLSELMETKSVVEDKVKIDKEISLIVARNEDGEVKDFPLVEMEFNPTANLVEFLLAPAEIDENIKEKAKEIGVKLAEALDLVGIMAIEMFITIDGDLLINETAPRPHNSGHQTIEANITSQYEQHLRAVLNLPLGSTDQTMSAVMVNLLGEKGHTGKAKYEGIEEVLGMNGTKVHIYGKELTKPFRKMGHVTVVDSDKKSALEKAKKVKDKLKVIT